MAMINRKAIENIEPRFNPVSEMMNGGKRADQMMSMPVLLPNTTKYRKVMLEKKNREFFMPAAFEYRVR